MLKAIKSFTIVCLSIYTAQAAPLQSKRYFDNTGGLIDHISPLLIPDKNASALTNITLDFRGQLQLRTGYTILDTTGTLASTSTAVTGGGYHTATSGSNFFAVIVGTNVYRTTNSFGGSFTNVTSTVVITNVSSNLAQHTALNDSIIFCNESDAPFRLNASTSALALSSAGGAPSGMKTCTTYGSYLLGANTTESGTAFPSRIRWSDINQPDTWPALNFIDIEPNDGDKIVSIVTFKDSVYVFKKRSIYRLMTTGLAGADAFIVRPFSRNIGCWAKNSVRVIPNVGIAFLAQNTAYILSDNELSSYNYSQMEAIGDPIQRTFDSIQRAQWGNVVAAVYPKRYQYWLSVSTSGSSNNEVLVYDYIQKSWTTYTDMNINMMDQAEDNTGQNVLITGDYTGNIYKQDNGTIDNPLNVMTTIPGSYTTADLLLDAPEITKNFKYLYVFTKTDLNTTLSVKAAYDYSSSYEYSNSFALGTAGALYGTATYGTDIYPFTGFNVSRLELNRSARSVKLNFTTVTQNATFGVIGWVLVYSPEDYKE